MLHAPPAHPQLHPPPPPYVSSLDGSSTTVATNNRDGTTTTINHQPSPSIKSTYSGTQGMFLSQDTLSQTVFAASVLCASNLCVCEGCQNTETEVVRGDRGAIALARRQVLIRNPNAFVDEFLESTAGGGGGGGSSSSRSPTLHPAESFVV
jgi:hypothetical protein